MAITESALNSATKNDGGGTFTTAATASVSPGANQLVLVDVFHNASVAANAANPTGVAGAGLTFNLVDSIVDTAAGSVLSRWRALSASPSTGAITATLANATVAAVISAHQYAGVDTSGTNGSGAIVQTAKNSNNAGTVNTVTATLAAFGSANNGVSSAHGWFNASGTVQTATPKSGWTEIHDAGTTYSGATLSDSLETQWRATNDTTASATWTANGAVYALSSEIKASPNVTLALTGVAATAAVGAVAPSLLKLLTGNSATSAVGSVTPSTSVAVTGVQGTTSVGSVGTAGDVTVPLTGVAAASAVGSLIPATTVGLTGVVGSSAAGTPGIATSLGLTGVSGTAAAGTLAPNLILGLTGVPGTASVGTVIASSGGDLTLALTGVSATAQVGNVSPSGGDATSAGDFIVRARRRGSR